MSYDDACKFVEDIAACRWVHIRGACAGSFLDFEDVASSAEHFNVIAVECLVFALMCLKPCDQNCIHCVFLAAGHGLLAAGTHAIHPILFLCCHVYVAGAGFAGRLGNFRECISRGDDG